MKHVDYWQGVLDSLRILDRDIDLVAQPKFSEDEAELHSELRAFVDNTRDEIKRLAPDLRLRDLTGDTFGE